MNKYIQIKPGTIGVVGDSMMDCYDPPKEMAGIGVVLPGGAALCASLCKGNLYSHITEDFKLYFKDRINLDNCKMVDAMTIKLYKDGVKHDYDVVKNYDYDFSPTEPIVIYCDYNKGSLINVKLPKDIITIVDPKHRPLDRWHGCTIFKCNKFEAMWLCGTDNMRNAAKSLQEELKCEMVVITLGDEGICGSWKKPFCHHIAGVEIKNTVGCGDRVCASLAIAIQNGYTNLEEAAVYAMNEATKYAQISRP